MYFQVSSRIASVNGMYKIVPPPLGHYGYSEGAVASLDEAAIDFLVYEIEFPSIGEWGIKVDEAW